MKQLLLLLLLIQIGIAGNTQTLQPSSVTIFKNGSYFIMKEGTALIENNSWKMVVPSSPFLSTFWLTTTKDFKITRVDFGTDTLKTNRTAQTIPDLMYANKGKHVKMSYTLNQNSSPSVSGVLEDYFRNTSIVKVKTDDGKTLYINSGQIIEFYVIDAPQEKFTVDSLPRMAKIWFNKSTGSAPLRVSYMQSGMTWIPSYNIKVIDDKSLQLEMKALVENYAEATNDIDLTLTVGAPNFKYGTQADPLSLNYYTGGSASYVAPTYYDYSKQWSNALTAGYSYDESTVAPVDYNNYQTYTTEGDKTNDLYMYKLGKTSLPMNSKSQFSIFSASVPYESIYECNVYDASNYQSTQVVKQQDDLTFDVFHSYKISNNTTFPFTTAPCFVQDENLSPLAQDMVKYTPVNGKVKVQLSKSPDVVVKNTEVEIEKIDNAKKYNSYQYRKVIIKGSITIQNSLDKEMKLCLTKSITGLITKASDSGDIKSTGAYNGLNPYSTAEYNITLQPNETKTLSYEYEVYVYQGY